MSKALITTLEKVEGDTNLPMYKAFKFDITEDSTQQFIAVSLTGSVDLFTEGKWTDLKGIQVNLTKKGTYFLRDKYKMTKITQGTSTSSLAIQTSEFNKYWSNLSEISLGSGGIVGDIKYLAELPKLNILQLGNVPTGTIEEFVNIRRKLGYDGTKGIKFNSYGEWYTGITCGGNTIQKGGILTWDSTKFSLVNTTSKIVFCQGYSDEEIEQNQSSDWSGCTIFNVK